MRIDIIHLSFFVFEQKKRWCGLNMHGQKKYSIRCKSFSDGNETIYECNNMRMNAGFCINIKSFFAFWLAAKYVQICTLQYMQELQKLSTNVMQMFWNHNHNDAMNEFQRYQCVSAHGFSRNQAWQLFFSFIRCVRQNILCVGRKRNMRIRMQHPTGFENPWQILTLVRLQCVWSFDLEIIRQNTRTWLKLFENSIWPKLWCFFNGWQWRVKDFFGKSAQLVVPITSQSAHKHMPILTNTLNWILNLQLDAWPTN